MKSRNLLRFLFLLTLLFSSTISNDDACPSGMRKTYVDDLNMDEYGSARRWLGAVCFFQFPGSLFFSRQVLIEPRFEVHLKSAVDAIDIVESSGEQKIYGYTIVISGYKNTLSGLDSRTVSSSSSSLSFNDIGYNNFVNSLVIEFDFVKDNNDPDENSFSIRYCDTSCYSDDTNAFAKQALSSQKYIAGQKNEWDFRFVYDNKKFTLYSGPNTKLYQTDYDLEKMLGTNIAYVGFTGFMESNRGELNLIGTFMCEDNYAINKIKSYFYKDGKFSEQASYEPGEKISFAFSFYNLQDNQVPHTFGYNIWNYTFFTTQDCNGTPVYTISKLDNYTLIMTTTACTTVGSHFITINEKTKGSGKDSYYTVIPGDMNKIEVVGYNGVIGSVPIKNNSDLFYLNYGKGAQGEFILTDDLSIVLDLKISDKYGNKVSVTSPDTFFTLKEVKEGGSTSIISNDIIKYELNENGDYYQMIISVSNVGTFQIENNDYMTKPIRFDVISVNPDATKSICELVGYSSVPTVKVGEKLIYKCNLIDSKDNKININAFIRNSIYQFTCSLVRTWPSEKTISPVTYNDDYSYYCNYTSDEVGNFAYNAYLILNTTQERVKITSKINQFNVRGKASTYIIKRIFEPSTKSWINFETGKTTQITYTPSSEGFITAIDFAESDGNVLISSYDEYPDDFHLANLVVKFYNPHDDSYVFAQPLVKEYPMNGKPYIGIFTKDTNLTDEVFKKSSFAYYLKFNYTKESTFEEKYAAINYVLNIGSYKTCFHDLNEENTNITISDNINIITGGDEVKLGSIILTTTDDNLYNYDIGKSKIQFNLQPTNDDIKFRVVPLSIEGTYDIYANSTQNYDGKVELIINDKNIKDFNIKSEPPEACYLSLINLDQKFNCEPTINKETYCNYTGEFTDGNLLISFYLKDKKNNTIDDKDYFNKYNDDIKSEDFEKSTDYYSITYNPENKSFSFRDDIPYSETQHGWVFTMRESTCKNIYYIRYDGKNGGSPLNISQSYFTLLNTEININNDEYVDVIYKDKKGQFYGLQGDKLNEIQTKTKVEANNSKGKSFKFNYYQTTSNYALRYKFNFTESGIYTVTVKYIEEELAYKTTNIFNVIDNIYNLESSKLKIITDNVVEMSTDRTTTIDNKLYRPNFRLEFYSKDNIKTNYDKYINFRLVMNSDDMSRSIVFIVNKNNDEFVQFNFPENEESYFDALKRGNYKLTLYDNNTNVVYPIALTGDNYTDSSNEEEYDLSKTEIYPLIINGIAGETNIINVEFRAKDGLRWNYLVEISNFKMTNSQNLDTKDISYKIENGPKKGQVVIFINQTKALDLNYLTFTYNGNEIPKKVTLNIKCNILKNLTLIEPPTYGNVINPPTITFKPYDAYGNLYTDLFSSSVKQDEINALTVGRSENAALTPSNYLSGGEKLVVQYNSTATTSVSVYSDYFEGSHTYRIYSGPIHKDTSFAEITSSTTAVNGDYTLLITPRDIYNNNIDNLNSTHLNEFKVYYRTYDTKEIIGNAECYLVEKSSSNTLRNLLTEEQEYLTSSYTNIECKATITKAGTLQFVVEHNSNNINCKNQCTFNVVSTTIEFSNAETLYTNKNTKLSTETINSVEIETTPIFHVSFYDNYKNQLEASVVNNIKLTANLEGTDVKLCVSDDGKIKSITVCASSNGDDNENKWKYLTNGNNYYLTLVDNNSNQIKYRISLNGIYSGGSSDKADLSKTSISPTTLNVIAGAEGKINVEIRTSDNIRKNYWYPEPSEKIKVSFKENEDTCDSSVEKASNPGQYNIKINCTKTNSANSITIIIEEDKSNQKTVGLTINSGSAYYLEVTDTNKFSISSDKYTWIKNPSNDDTINFNFKLKDIYQNYITNNLINSESFTITSETFGSSNTYYSLQFTQAQYNYLFTDRINEAVTKHTWNILIINSNRKYSFIYTKVPGAPDYSRSYWEIDKTSYILKETSKVTVYLVDKLGVNLGTLDGNLDSKKENIQVQTIKDSKNALYSYNSINSNNIQYTYIYESIGNYKVSVFYNSQIIGKQKDINVAYQTVDLQKSKLYYNIDNTNDILMSTSIQTNINCLKDYPFYKFLLYTSNGERITLYDKSKDISCKMTYGNEEWVMVVKKLDDYIQIEYESGFQEKFSKLPQGLYHIQIIYDGKYIRYPLHLLGEEDVSPSSDYDEAKIYIKPTEIEAIAGEEKEIEIEFRANDGLRWNYEINLNSFGVSYSDGYSDNDIKIEKIKGNKNGQMKLKIVQTKSTTNKPNTLSFKYMTKQITQTVSLTIKPSTLNKLVYNSGLEDGTVINPPTLSFLPYDKYNNLCTDISDKTKYPQTILNSLTKGNSIDKYSVTSNIYTNENSLYVSYGCSKVTTIQVTSNSYFTITYSYKLNSGPIDPKNTYAEIAKYQNVIAGDTTTINIYPKDANNNEITSLSNTDKSKFEIYYNIGGSSSVSISNCMIQLENKYITCQTIITKSGDIDFGVDYSNTAVQCNNCEFNINPSALDFSKTKVVNQNNNKEMSKDTNNILTVSTNPNFILSFYDKYMNSIVNENEVNNLVVSSSIEITDVLLCIKNNKLNKISSLCPNNNDENQEKWKYVPNGDNYKLKITSNNQNLIYPITITGGYTDGESGAIDITKTYLNPTKLTLTAGIESSILLELRTANNVRKNYWFKEPISYLAAAFPQNVKDCSYTFAEGSKPGQYNFKFICTKKRETFQTTILVNNSKVSQNVQMNVVPNEPTSSKLFKNNQEITTNNLGEVSVEDQYQMVNVLYDKYSNIIDSDDIDLSILKLNIIPSTSVTNHIYTIDSESKKGNITLTVKSTYAGEHIIQGKFLPDNYTITFIPGNPNAENSLLSVSEKEAWVEQIIKIYITPYDKYFNLIDAKKFEKQSPFNVKFTSEGKEAQLIKENYKIEKVGDINVISYPGNFTVRGYTNLVGYLDTNSIKCVSCRVNIKSKDIDFKSSLIYRYESSKNEYEILKDGAIEKNAQENPIYRLYPRDKYNNTIDYIPQDKIVNYKSCLEGQNDTVTYELKLNNKEAINPSYAEFVINDDEEHYGYTYASLVQGYYYLNFTDDTDKISYNISLLGDGKGGSNAPVDLQKTHINDQNLKFIAGESGYILLEMRTINNQRKNNWNYNIDIISCDETDTTFKAESNKAGTKGTFHITITTKKANTYPSLVKCPLKISINGELVKNLSPEMEVSPNTVVKTEILDEYYLNKANNELKEGDADHNYVFEVASYDQYNNLAETKQETIGLKVILKGGSEITQTTSVNNASTGYRKYSSSTTKIGTYVVSTSKSGSQGVYLQKEAYFIIKPGAIYLGKTIIKEKVTPIQAGNNPVIYIIAYDQYDNQLDYNNYINKFQATFIDSDGKNFDSDSTYDKELKKVFYTSKNPVTIVGNTRVEVQYDDGTILDTSKVVILIIPGDPLPSNSILSYNSNKYANGESFVIYTTETLKLSMLLYDKYNNYVYELPANAQVENPIMSGNKMKQISFSVTKNTANFDLAFDENSNYVHIYQHLVKGDYDLNLRVSSSLGTADFHYIMKIIDGDDYHGNGDYDISKCVLKPDKVSFVAGKYQTFLLELRTEEGKLYNDDDIDLKNDISINNGNANDSSFKPSVEKTNSTYGYYTISIYSTKRGDYNLNVELKDPSSSSEQKIKVSPAKYTVTPEPIPCKNYTNIISKPDTTITIDTKILITFELFDRFNNKFLKEDNITNITSYYTLYNDGKPYISYQLNFYNSRVDLSLMPNYPPKIMILNLLYNNDKTSVYIFKEDINITIETEIDYSKTKIESGNKEKIKTGEILEMNLTTFDKNGICFDGGDLSSQFKVQVTGPLSSTKQFVKTYQIRKIKIVASESSDCNNKYEIITTDDDKYKYAGNYLIKVIYAETHLLEKYDQVCYPSGYSLKGFYLTYTFDPDSISILDYPSFTITGSDEYGNTVTEPLYDSISISFTNNDNNTDFETKQILETQQGTLNYQIGIKIVGTHQLNIFYNNQKVTEVNEGQDLPKFTIVPGPCYDSNNSHFNLNPLNYTEISLKTYFSFDCYDQFDNKIKKGGESFTVRANYLSETNQQDTISIDSAKVVDKGNGTYFVEFVPTMKGTYLFNIFRGNEKYGKEIKWVFKAFTCLDNKKILCPNKKECVSDILECIDPIQRCTDDAISAEKPFKCKINKTETCTASQTDCDCPDGYHKCEIMNYCVPNDKQYMCPKFKNLYLFCLTNNMVYNIDGICRKEKIGPNQRVCPIGKVLCADLSCRDSYDDCYVTDKKNPLLQRCIGQQIVTSATLCPSTITCSSESEVVCPTGECVSNEIYCPALNKCNNDYPYLCQNNVCAKDYDSCPPSISCGENKLLCSDNICREKC